MLPGLDGGIWTSVTPPEGVAAEARFAQLLARPDHPTPQLAAFKRRRPHDRIWHPTGCPGIHLRSLEILRWESTAVGRAFRPSERCRIGSVVRLRDERRIPIRTELLRAGDPAWDDWLIDVPRDVYHTAGYHAYAQGSGEGEPFLIVVGDRQRGFAWPYLLRTVSEVEGLAGAGGTDVTSVYGYSGPLAWGCAPGDPFLATAWSEVLSVWREQGAVSAFTRFHPLLGNASLLSALPWPRDRADEPEPVVALGRTVSIDLSVSEEAARAGYSENLRRQISNFRQAGLTTTHDEDWTSIAAFVHLYRETMARNAAADYYFFDAANLGRLHAALSGHVHLLLTRMDEVVGAAGLFTECGGIVQTHLVATNAALASMSPNKVLVDDAQNWARKRGNRVLHLGGGRGAREDSLFEFKRRFSPRRHLFFTGRWILDRPAYRGLLEAHLAAARGDKPLDPGYFPAYRAPVLTLEADPKPIGLRPRSAAHDGCERVE